MNTWKHLLSKNDLEKGVEIFALDEIVPAVEELLRQNEVPSSFYISVLINERMIHSKDCRNVDEGIEWLRDIEVTKGVIAVKCQLSAGIALLANSDEFERN